MDPFEARLNDIEKSFAQLSTEHEKFSFLSTSLGQDQSKHEGVSFTQLNQSMNTPVHSERRSESQKDQEFQAILHLLERNNLSPAVYSSFLSSHQSTDSKSPPIRNRLPCARHDAETCVFCPNDGTLACSACRLVSYCSKECQKSDWKKHKQDCQNPMMSTSWRPLWEVQGRAPDFMSDSDSSISSPSWRQTLFGGGAILWGNTPAISVLGNPTEGDSFDERDFALAFIASGDLRNMIKTVNSLPEDYNGKLNILLNDRNPLVVARNILILSALSFVEDEDQAVDFALHLWYSVFLPTKESFLATASFIQRLLASEDEDLNLSQTSTMSLSIHASTLETILVALDFGTMDVITANNALNAVMNAPERVDYRDRVYTPLKPSHRVALQEWRRFGLLMPFGAPNPHLNQANTSLISPSGQVWFYDSAIPLEGWDIDDILRAGRKHGTTEEDIMGCLHYHVKDELTAFFRRLRKFSIAFSIYDQDAIELSDTLPPHLRQFDRIEVSNIVDHEYAGISPVLTKWGPMLNRDQSDSTLIASFINWAARAPKARAAHDMSVLKPCMDRLLQVRPDIINQADLMRGSTSIAMLTVMSSLDVVHDTSPAFKQYLVDVDADTAARRAGLRMRERNQIVPPRPCVPTESDWNVLPDISTKEKWYNKVPLSGLNHTERFVEWVSL